VIGSSGNSGTDLDWVSFVAGSTQTYYLQVFAYSTSVYRVSVITDTPPQVNFVPPSALTAGTAISLPIDVVDPDGDPLTYDLLYGPSGMTVDADGNLNWTAEQVGYFPDYTVHWAVRVQSGDISIDYTDTLQVTNPDHAAPMARSGIEVPTRNNGFAAGDFDRDGKTELLVTDNGQRLYTLEYDGTNYGWSLADSTSYLTYQAITVANIDSDPEDEIIVGESQWGDIVSISYDQTNDTLVEDWRTPSENDGVSSIISADLDNDGALEVAWASGIGDGGADSLLVAGLDPGFTLEWDNLTRYPTVSTSIPQLDGPFLGAYWFNVQAGQPRALFVSPRTDSGYDGARLITMDATNGAMQISPEIGTNSNAQFALNVADYDSDGSDEIFAASSDYYDGYFTVYDFLTDTNEWNSPASQGVGTAVATGDLNGDGAADFAVATTDGYIRAYDILNQTLIWSNGGTPNTAQDVEIADVDGDGTQEIITAVDNSVAIFEKSTGGYSQRSVAALNGVSDIAISDLDGDGKLEIAAIAAGSYYTNGQVALFDSNLTQTSSFTTGVGLNAVFFDDSSANVKLILSFSDDIFYSETGHLAWVDPMTGDEIYRSPALLGIVQKNSLHLADTNGNGHKELIFGASKAMYITR
jgi:hypothetical protein